MKWVWISTGSIGIVLAVGIALWVVWPGKNALSPQETTKALREILGRNPNLGNPAPNTWLTHKSASLQFAYPSHTIIYTADNQKADKQPGMLDSFSFYLPDNHAYAVVQVALFNGNLQEYPAVNLRLSQHTIYTQVSTSSGVMQFRKEQDMVERSAFFLKNGKVVSVAVTGYSDTNVQNLFEKLLGSLEVF